jgi:predicted RNA binding protein YcfA (HicA-like mRNA interferase family)
MPNIKNLSGKEVIKILESFGFEQLRQKGSHIILIKKTESGKIGCVVPNHKEVKFGTIKGILKQANITIKDFIEKIN